MPTATEAAQQRRTDVDAAALVSADVDMLPAPVEVLAPAPQPQPDVSDMPGLSPAVEAALAERQQQEANKLAAWHHAELGQLEHVLSLEADEKLTWLARHQQVERDAFHKEQKRTGIDGYINALQNRLNPGRGAEQRQARDHAWKQMHARHARERADLKTLLDQNTAEHIEELKERHDQQQRDQQAGFALERTRYAEDAARAARLLEQVEEDRREAERQRQQGRAADPPPRHLK